MRKHLKKFVALLMNEKRPRMNEEMTPTFFLFPLLSNLFKLRYISSVTSYKDLNKLISEV